MIFCPLPLPRCDELLDAFKLTSGLLSASYLFSSTPAFLQLLFKYYRAEAICSFSLFGNMVGSRRGGRLPPRGEVSVNMAPLSESRSYFC